MAICSCLGVAYHPCHELHHTLGPCGKRFDMRLLLHFFALATAGKLVDTKREGMVSSFRLQRTVQFSERWVGVYTAYPGGAVCVGVMGLSQFWSPSQGLCTLLFSSLLVRVSLPRPEVPSLFTRVSHLPFLPNSMI